MLLSNVQRAKVESKSQLESEEGVIRVTKLLSNVQRAKVESKSQLKCHWIIAEPLLLSNVQRAKVESKSQRRIGLPHRY